MIYVVIWGDFVLVLLGEMPDMALLHLANELKAVRNLKLFIDVVDVRLDSVHGNVQLFCDTRIGQPFDQ